MVLGSTSLAARRAFGCAHDPRSEAMCGIVGIFDTREAGKIDPDILAQMNARLDHRGPDDAGCHLGAGVGLGHRRLSIIDLSPLGHQPLFNEDGSVCVVFNGEIYNFRDLVPLLQAKGHQFRSRCDTEVIVHAWEEWGEDCVRHFQGMYAFAVWDERQQSLFLARDRFGEKPLYYALLDNGHFIFGSELKALLVHPLLRRHIDPQAVADYFSYGYVPDPRTIYKSVSKLAPAHCVTVRRGAASIRPREYWDVRFIETEQADEAVIADELVDRLRAAVSLRMMADVPLGAFLSGGVDSSAVVAMMAQQSAAPVNTCSISFNEQAFDESAYALKVATRFATNHFSRTVDAEDFALLDRLAGFYDEPFADSSALPTYLVCALARERVTVALSGDGGDEIFAGYRRYYWHQNEQWVRSLLPHWLRAPLFGMIGAVYPKLDWAPRYLRARATLQNFARDTAEAYFNTICAVPAEVRQRLFSPTHARELQGYRPIDVLRHHMARADTRDPLSQVQYADIKTYLPGDILTKVDRASMAVSLEVRVPLLDHDLVQWLATVPSSMKLHGRTGKYVFKKALEPYLPREVLHRPKMGFAVPLKSWFRGPLRERARRIVTEGILVDTGMFDVRVLRTLVDQHQAGQFDHSSAIWTLMMFEAFLRTVHDTKSNEQPVSPRADALTAL
jgi:asparagine synthase (glutamine-hydrolysing)